VDNIGGKMKKETIKQNSVHVIAMMIVVLTICCVMYYVSWCVAWNIEGGVFVRAEVHPERQINVTYIVLEDRTLMYGTCNPEVLDLEPGEYYWFGEGLISGNYGKRLIWVADENPLTV
jgi:hypothetical protein